MTESGALILVTSGPKLEYLVQSRDEQFKNVFTIAAL